MAKRDLSNPELQADLTAMIRRGHTIPAIKRLREEPGWSLADAKCWVDQALEGYGVTKNWTGKPCPDSAKPLRADSAKQCFACGMDWHDASNIIQR